MVDIQEWSICGGGRLERFYCIFLAEHIITFGLGGGGHCSCGLGVKVGRDMTRSEGDSMLETR